MQDGVTFNLATEPNVFLLFGALITLAGLWVLLSHFPREAKRLCWSWSKPRALKTRNASETPRTLGVMTSHIVTFIGLLSAWSLLHRAWPTPTDVLFVISWMISIATLRWIVARLLFRERDFSSVLSEISRHNHTRLSVICALWCIIASLNPVVKHSIWSQHGVIIAFVIGTSLGAFRTSQLFQGQHQHRVGGILYLCTLEWGWLVGWTLWFVDLLP